MSIKRKSALSLIARQLHILIIAIFLIGLLPLPAMAADGTVTGQVTDNATGNPIQNTDVLFYESGAPDYFSISSTDNTGQYLDLVKAGVIDPTKVVRTALQNGASVASLMLTTATLVTELKEEKEAVEGAVH